MFCEVVFPLKLWVFYKFSWAVTKVANFGFRKANIFTSEVAPDAAVTIQGAHLAIDF